MTDLTAILYDGLLGYQPQQRQFSWLERVITPYGAHTFYPNSGGPLVDMRLFPDHVGLKKFAVTNETKALFNQAEAAESRGRFWKLSSPILPAFTLLFLGTLLIGARLGKFTLTNFSEKTLTYSFWGIAGSLHPAFLVVGALHTFVSKGAFLGTKGLLVVGGASMIASYGVVAIFVHRLKVNNAEGWDKRLEIRKALKTQWNNGQTYLLSQLRAAKDLNPAVIEVLKAIKLIEQGRLLHQVYGLEPEDFFLTVGATAARVVRFIDTIEGRISLSPTRTARSVYDEFYHRPAADQLLSRAVIFRTIPKALYEFPHRLKWEVKALTASVENFENGKNYGLVIIPAAKRAKLDALRDTFEKWQRLSTDLLNLQTSFHRHINANGQPYRISTDPSDSGYELYFINILTPSMVKQIGEDQLLAEASKILRGDSPQILGNPQRLDLLQRAFNNTLVGKGTAQEITLVDGLTDFILGKMGLDQLLKASLDIQAAVKKATNVWRIKLIDRSTEPPHQRKFAEVAVQELAATDAGISDYIDQLSQDFNTYGEFPSLEELEAVYALAIFLQESVPAVETTELQISLSDYKSGVVDPRIFVRDVTKIANKHPAESNRILDSYFYLSRHPEFDVQPAANPSVDPT